MATNLIQNPDFNSGLNSWSTFGWYPGNTITALSSGGQNGACVKLVVPSEGDPGQSWIAQSLQLESGKDYTLSFYAKRTGNVDVWFEITMAGETEYSQSYRNEIPSGGDYTSISYDFTAADTVDDTVSVNIRLIAGSAGGTVWFDTVCLETASDNGSAGVDNGSAGVITGNYVNVRAEPGTSAAIIAQVNTGDKVTYYAGETYYKSGYYWYRCTSTKWPGDGYIATQYVQYDESSGSSGSDSTGDENSNGFSTNCYVEVLSGARGYKTADATDPNNYGRIPAGALFVYGGVENGMVRVKYGTSTGDTINAYIPKDKCRNSGTTLENNIESRMATIAESLVGAYGANLGLSGNYCESFVHWLAGAADMPHNVYCGSNVCGDAVEYYTNAGQYAVRNSTTGLYMQTGDIAYYDVTNYGSSAVTAAHAGFVIDASGDSYIAIEGNADSENVNSNGQMAIVRITGNRYTGNNSTHNRTLHGVGCPFGRG